MTAEGTSSISPAFAADLGEFIADFGHRWPTMASDDGTHDHGDLPREPRKLMTTAMTSRDDQFGELLTG